MKPKCSEMVEYLKQYKTPQTSAQISSALNISVRSVKSYIKGIIAEYPQPMICATRDGYQLSQFNSSFVITTQEIPQTQEERSTYIIKRLIEQHPEGLNLFDLCDELAISYSTLKSTISFMNSRYESYHVKFRSAHNCLFILGDNKEKRKFISWIIYQSSEPSILDVPQLKNWFSNIDVDNVSQIVLNTSRQFDYYINHLSLVDLLLHLLIIIDQDTGTQATPCCSKLQDSKIQSFIETLISRLEGCLSHHFSQCGKNEIGVLFSSSMNYSKAINDASMNDLIGADVLALTDAFIKKLTKTTW